MKYGIMRRNFYCKYVKPFFSVMIYARYFQEGQPYFRSSLIRVHLAHSILQQRDKHYTAVQYN